MFNRPGMYGGSPYQNQSYPYRDKMYAHNNGPDHLALPVPYVPFKYTGDVNNKSRMTIGLDARKGVFSSGRMYAPETTYPPVKVRSNDSVTSDFRNQGYQVSNPGRDVGNALGPISGILGSAAGGAAALGEAAIIGGIAAAPVLAAGAAVAGIGYGTYKLGEAFHLW